MVVFIANTTYEPRWSLKLRSSSWSHSKCPNASVAIATPCRRLRVQTLRTLPAPRIVIDKSRDGEKLLRRLLSLCSSLCRPDIYRSSEPRGLVSASSKPPAENSFGWLSRTTQRHCAFANFDFFLLLHFCPFQLSLEFQRSLVEREMLRASERALST